MPTTTVTDAGVVSIPTLSSSVGGAPVKSLIGAKPRQLIAAEIDDLLT